MKKYILFSFLGMLLQVHCKGQVEDPRNIYGDDFPLPKLLGGYDSLYKAIKSRTVIPLHCPEPERKKPRVFVSLVVNKMGRAEAVKVTKGICPEADSLALRIVRGLKFQPAKSQGELFDCPLTIPILFYKREWPCSSCFYRP